MVIEPPNFGAPVAGSSVDEAITADVTGAVEFTPQPAIGPQRGHLDYSMEPHPSADPRQGRGSAVHTVDPAVAPAGFHEGRRPYGTIERCSSGPPVPSPGVGPDAAAGHSRGRRVVGGRAGRRAMTIYI